MGGKKTEEKKLTNKIFASAEKGTDTVKSTWIPNNSVTCNNLAFTIYTLSR